MAVTLYEPIVYGDTEGVLSGRARAQGQVISLPADVGARSLVGDANALLGFAQGGADTLTSFASGATTVIGDAVTVGGRALGGNDTVLAGASGSATAAGDAVTLEGRAHAGDDIVEARSDFAAVAYGDAHEIAGQAVGGDDHVTGWNAHGVAELYGDAETLRGSARGGDDTVYASTGYPTHMYGDGAELLDRSRGGDDRLVSGTNADEMWGDAAVMGPRAKPGADDFVFSPGNGPDSIMEFGHGKDHIELAGFGYSDFSDVQGLISYSADGALITFDAENSILVAGVNELVASDFVFT
jgi:hypothetical protein